MTGENDPITLADAASRSADARRRKHKKYNAKRYAKNPAAEIARVGAWQKRNPKKTRAKSKSWRERNVDRLRWYNIRRNFGLTKSDWEALFASQGNVCGICGSETPGAVRGWHTDHCHATKVVRGILCHPCNTLLGRAKDSVEILLLAAEYLKRHGAKS